MKEEVEKYIYSVQKPQYLFAILLSFFSLLLFSFFFFLLAIIVISFFFIIELFANHHIMDGTFTTITISTKNRLRNHMSV